MNMNNNNNMRRKNPAQGGSGGSNFSGPHKKPRYTLSGGDRPNQNYSNQHNNNRPRKNYSASREKYLAQARDALASGDRVLAENYFQHADHCYRMMMEEAQNQPPRQRYTPPADQQPPQGEESAQEDSAEAKTPEHADPLPAFLTVNYEGESTVPAPAVQWDE